jgi:peptide deformylase
MSAPLEFQIRIYPEPVLRKRAEPVERFDEELQAFVAAMFQRMRDSQGVGLAAPQVGHRLRILVLNPTGEPGDDLALVNPEIVERSGPQTTFEEGCLSFPSIYAEVVRPDRCRVQARDVQGEAIELELEGFPSRIVQHEYDHLEGVLLVDRMSPGDEVRNKAALEDLVEEYRERRAKAATQAR